MSEFKNLAIQRQVNELFTGRYFSISDFDNLAKLMGAKPDESIRRQLSAYHCVDYADMSDREKILIQEKVVECLRGDLVLNPARVLSHLTDEGGDFAFTEDRYIETPSFKRLS